MPLHAASLLLLGGRLLVVVFVIRRHELLVLGLVLEALRLFHQFTHERRMPARIAPKLPGYTG